MCNYFICDIRCVRKHLALDTSTALANALVSSPLDYCDSLLHSIPRVNLNKLQHIQISLTRAIITSTRFTSCKLLLGRFHWLQIASRIDFKIATLTSKVVHLILKQTLSLAKHLKLYSTHINTRLNDQLLLQHPLIGATVVDLT